MVHMQVLKLNYVTVWFYSHYHAVAVLVAQDSASDGSLGDPDADFNSFDSIDSVYSPACEKVSQTTAYIAAEFGSDEFQGSTLEFTFGKEEDTVNDRERYTNGPLCYSTSYGFFLRVYNDVVSINLHLSLISILWISLSVMYRVTIMSGDL